MGLISKLRIRNSLVREFFAELLGTFVLIVLGDGAVAQMVLTEKSLATYLSVNFGYAMAVAFGVYVSGGVSGGHINPAVTLVMAVIGRLKWIKVPVYMAGQYLGAFLGSAVVFGVYHDLIEKSAKESFWSRAMEPPPAFGPPIPTAKTFPPARSWEIRLLAPLCCCSS